MEIAILEDNGPLGKILKITLEMGGYKTHIFQTSKDFFAFLGIGQETIIEQPVGLIIVDYRLEDEQLAGGSSLTGDEVIRRVKAIYPNMQAVLISADPTGKFDSAAIALVDIGVRSIQKIFTMKELLNVIKQLEESADV